MKASDSFFVGDIDKKLLVAVRRVWKYTEDRRRKGEMRYAADNSDFTDKIFTGNT